MPRKTTTKVYREHVVSMVRAGKSTEQVARELGVEHHKIKRWCKNSSGTHSFSHLFDAPDMLEEVKTKATPQVPHINDKEKRRLEQENKHLRELVHLSTRWISAYVAMHSS